MSSRARYRKRRYLRAFNAAGSAYIAEQTQLIHHRANPGNMCVPRQPVCAEGEKQLLFSPGEFGWQRPIGTEVEPTTWRRRTDINGGTAGIPAF